ncbi:MAG: hypothetical protein ACI8X3_002306, partial [Saprospiraceae bacterium]
MFFFHFGIEAALKEKLDFWMKNNSHKATKVQRYKGTKRQC